MSWIRYDSAMIISNCVPEPNNKRDFAELFMMQYKMVKPLIIFWQCTVYTTDHELSELKGTRAKVHVGLGRELLQCMGSRVERFRGQTYSLSSSVSRFASQLSRTRR